MGAILKAFVRMDANERVVPGSLVLRKSKPKNGKWFEIPQNKCCGVGGSVVVDITAFTLATDATVTVSLGCGSAQVTEVTITTVGANEAARRADLVAKLTSNFGGFGTFVLETADSVRFTSNSTCVDPVFTLTA
jgi:hypothetical protein